MRHSFTGKSFSSFVYNFFFVVLFSSTFSFSARSEDGPFGVAMNSKPSDYGCSTSENNKSAYVCKSLPKSHKDFEAYVLFYHPSNGICQIKALGRDISTNAYGEEIKSKVDEIANQVGKSYGKLKLYDFLKAGSMWDEPQEWIASFSRGERVYTYVSEKKSMKNNVISIVIGAKVANAFSDTGHLYAEFTFSNQSECMKNISEEEGSAF